MASGMRGAAWRGAILAALAIIAGCTGTRSDQSDPSASAREPVNTQVVEESRTSPQAALGCDSDSESFSEYSSPGWNQLTSYPNNNQVVLVGSDLQAYRYMVQRSPYVEHIDRNSWIQTVAPVLQAIRAERRSLNYYVPFIVNGDLTDYGHGNERRDTRDLLRANLPGGRAGPLMLPGMGNHDYDNNVDNCGNNGCARDAVCDLITWAQEINPKNSFDYQYVSNNRHRGSMSYSVTVGRVHIVQLNLEPTYTRSFETGGGLTGKPKRYFDITGAMNWLEADLRAAAARGEQIIINLHKRNAWKYDAERTGWFSDIVNQYRVAAIFAGHYHSQLGAAGTLGKVPIFQSGGLLAKSYLRVNFDWANMKLRVEPKIVGGGYILPTVVDLPSRFPADEVGITLYDHEQFQGDTCSFGIKKGQTFDLRSTACSSLVNRVSSATVENFSPGDRVCFKGDNGTRCITGQYQGGFGLWTFTGRPSLPDGLTMEVAGGDMNDKITGVDRNFSVEDGYEVTLYENYDYRGASCTLRLPPSHLRTYVERVCGAGWGRKVSSMRMPYIPYGHRLVILGVNPEREVWAVVAQTYSGPINIPRFSVEPRWPEGVWLSKGVDGLNDNVYYLNLRTR